MTVNSDHTYFVGNDRILTHNAKPCRIVSSFVGNGKVAYSSKFTPKPKEIDAANFLANKEGASIYIRGGKSTKGADFFINGKRWELKTLDAGTSNAVGNNIKKSLRKGNQGKDFIIDGRKAGLTRDAFLKGIDNAIRDRKVPSRVRGILKDGSIIEWPGI